MDDFANDWKDGIAFLALLDSLSPGKFKWGDVAPMPGQERTAAMRLELAFKLFLVELGVPKLLDPEDLEGPGKILTLTLTTSDSTASSTTSLIHPFSASLTSCWQELHACAHHT